MEHKLAEEGKLGFCAYCQQYTFFVKPDRINPEADFPMVFHLTKEIDPENSDPSELVRQGYIDSVCDSQTIRAIAIHIGGDMDQAIRNFISIVIRTIPPRELYFQVPPELADFFHWLASQNSEPEKPKPSESKSKKYIN
jgi:hypothetical protein